MEEFFRPEEFSFWTKGLKMFIFWHIVWHIVCDHQEESLNSNFLQTLFYREGGGCTFLDKMQTPLDDSKTDFAPDCFELSSVHRVYHCESLCCLVNQVAFTPSAKCSAW